jgi:hypothetical protein
MSVWFLGNLARSVWSELSGNRMMEISFNGSRIGDAQAVLRCVAVESVAELIGN